MKPFQSYVPTTMEYLPAAVKHCVKHDRECRKIAEKGFSLATCELSLETQTQYMAHVLHFVQELQLSMHDTTVLGVSQG